MFIILITEVSLIPALGRLAAVAPFILGGCDGRDVGCGLGTLVEIRFPSPHKSKHSQSAVCAVHPRSPTASLKLIYQPMLDEVNLYPLINFFQHRPGSFVSSPWAFLFFKKRHFGGLKREKGSLLSPVMFWSSWDWHGSWQKTGTSSWKRVINKHFNGNVERCQQASGHVTTLAHWRPSRSYYMRKML